MICILLYGKKVHRLVVPIYIFLPRTFQAPGKEHVYKDSGCVTFQSSCTALNFLQLSAYNLRITIPFPFKNSYHCTGSSFDRLEFITINCPQISILISVCQYQALFSALNHPTPSPFFPIFSFILPTLTRFA